MSLSFKAHVNNTKALFPSPSSSSLTSQLIFPISGLFNPLNYSLYTIVTHVCNMYSLIMPLCRNASVLSLNSCQTRRLLLHEWGETPSSLYHEGNHHLYSGKQQSHQPASSITSLCLASVTPRWATGFLCKIYWCVFTTGTWDQQYFSPCAVPVHSVKLVDEPPQKIHEVRNTESLRSSTSITSPPHIIPHTIRVWNNV